MTLVATAASGASVTHTFDLVIASDDLRAAWRAGMGTLEPSCQQEIFDWQLVDANGDGRQDVMYRVAYEDYMGLRILVAGASSGYTAIDAVDGQGFQFSVEPGADGKPVVVVERNCCCVAEIYIYRLERVDGSDTLTELGGGQSESCETSGAFELMRDQSGRVRGFTETGKKKHRIWRLRKGALTEQ